MLLLILELAVEIFSTGGVLLTDLQGFLINYFKNTIMS